MRPAAFVDHYRALGVARTADAAEIRSAYLALIKRYHPDANQDGGGAEEDQAAAVNLAYTILRDPEARARHDEALRIADEEAAAHRLRLRVLATGGAVYTPPRAPSRGRRVARRIFWLLLILIAAGAAALFMEVDPPRLPEFSSASQARTAGEALPKRKRGPPIDDGGVADAVDDLLFIATNGNSADAVRYSSFCYAELEEQPSLRMADKCIGFDLAAGHWLMEKELAHETSWFSAAETEPRHERVLRLLLPDADATHRRLDALGRMAVSRIARHLAPPAPPAEAGIAENAQIPDAAGLSL